MALNGLNCAAVWLRIYSLTHSVFSTRLNAPAPSVDSKVITGDSTFQTIAIDHVLLLTRSTVSLIAKTTLPRCDVVIIIIIIIIIKNLLNQISCL